MIEVVCALIERDDRVLVAKRAVGKLMEGKWEFPGGKLHAGEEPEVAIVREIEEELGCVVSIQSPMPVSTHEYTDFAIKLIPFICRVVAGEPSALEHEEIAWAAREELSAFNWADADLPVVSTYVEGLDDSRF